MGGGRESSVDWAFAFYVAELNLNLSIPEGPRGTDRTNPEYRLLEHYFNNYKLLVTLT